MLPVTNQYSVLLIGIEERVLPILQNHFRAQKIEIITSSSQYDSLLFRDGAYAAIFCGTSISKLTGVAVGRDLHRKCPRTPKYFVTLDTASFHARKLLESGYDEAFLLPFDKADLKRTVEEKISDENENRSFQELKAVEIEVGMRLDFDTYVYLPLNNKYVKYTFAGQEFDESKLGKLKSRELTSLYVDKRELEKYYRFAARRLREPSESAHLPTEERTKRLRSAVRAIFADIFDPTVLSDPAAAEELLGTCRNVISNYITQGASSDWYSRLLNTLGEVGDSYSHSMNVSTYAALFAIGVENGNPRDLAMAGLLHDVGVSTLPEAITEKPPEKMTDEEKNLFYMHGDKTISLLKSKKIALPASVAEAIAQHHEMYNGKGYPKALSSDQISLGAQILSFADQFDYFTRFENGHGLNTVDAFEEIKRNGSISPKLLEQIWPLLDGKDHAPKVDQTADTDGAQPETRYDLNKESA